MNQVPHILLKQIQIYQPELQLTTAVDMCNKINEKINAHNKANAEQDQPLITVEEARKLGAGKAEYSYNSSIWDVCGANWNYRETFDGGLRTFKYRAIKQPEPVSEFITAHEAMILGKDGAEYFNELSQKWFPANPNTNHPDFKYRRKQPEHTEPHAELKAMYEQQVKDGTLDDFFWEYRHQETQQWYSIDAELGTFFPETFYRCTTKPTCQIKNLDTGELKTMTREAAKKLQAETKDTCDWMQPKQTLPWTGDVFRFDADGIYTYKLKANPVKLDGELMTREAAVAAWKSKLETHVMWFKLGNINWTDVIGFPKDYNKYFNDSVDCEYELRLKPTVKLTINDEPAKMFTSAQCEAERLARVDTHDVESRKHEEVFEPVITPVWWSLKAENGHEYRLIRKQPKLIPLDWKDVPVGVMTNKGELRGVYLGGDGAYRICTETRLRDDDINWSRFHASFVELAPASEQPWLVYIQGETDLSRLKGVEIGLKCVLISRSSTLVEVESPYSIEFMKKLPFIKAYRITGLAEGWVLK